MSATVTMDGTDIVITSYSIHYTKLYETVFLMASERNQFISSRFVKEVGRLGGDVSEFVPRRVREDLIARFRETEGE